MFLAFPLRLVSQSGLAWYEINRVCLSRSFFYCMTPFKSQEPEFMFKYREPNIVFRLLWRDLQAKGFSKILKVEKCCCLF